MADRKELPYDELPELGNLGVRHSWEVLPKEFGTLDRLDEGSVTRGVRSVSSGKTFGLSLPLTTFDPPLFGRPSVKHEVFEAGRNTYEDNIDSFNPQSASQWDGLGHVRAREHGYFGGITDDAEAHSALSVHRWAQHGIVGRGVLLDVAGHFERTGAEWDPFAGSILQVADLEAVAQAQDVTFERGDILCVRTGWVAEYRTRKGAGEDMTTAGDRFSGLSAAEPMARFLWDSGFAAVCTDNPAVESAPGNREDGSLHRRLIPALGFVLAELLDFDALAAHCAGSGRWDFLFTAAPLPLEGAVSSQPTRSRSHNPVDW
ncbi:cyclase family protein [Rhodococcus sp. ZPP]|uniref:cyclase family protein n=1 Tax=Rhodococcus sp. ZPP TaxID=2749906 RepID=UPI001AD85A58|nr:cyclase family protein [Rhodococcus sp. ZPP]